MVPCGVGIVLVLKLKFQECTTLPPVKREEARTALPCDRRYQKPQAPDVYCCEYITRGELINGRGALVRSFHLMAQLPNNSMGKTSECHDQPKTLEHCA